MVGLLALGPFLHGHVGASHDTGFHLDGVHAVHALGATDVRATQTGHDESPAMGVATSLPHPEDKTFDLLAWALLLAVLALLPHPHLPLPQAQRDRGLTRRLYRAGLPPPSLAPPSA